MAKAKDTVFYCSECGNESAKWSGQCPVCGEWNTLVEAPAPAPVKAQVRKAAGIIPGITGGKPSLMKDIDVRHEERIRTGIEEFDRVLGGGIVKGSLVLVGGDPGIGKSTLLTQVCRKLSEKQTDVLYISGEESLQQIKIRADRLGEFGDHMKLLCETDLEVIETAVSRELPGVCIIDSIQTIYRPDITGTPGSVTQVRECTGSLLQLSKGIGVAVIVVGHVTKEGVVAGPRMLEHMVDTVLYFEGDSQGQYRILRSVKNRFGATNEVGVFEMLSDGLSEVKNPSESLLSGRPENSSGSVVSCSVEGTRPILLEVQALVAKSVLGNPRRSATGIDYNRLNLLTAVLEKRLGMRLSECDIYVNIVGGLKVAETALDLAVVLAISSSHSDYSLPKDCMALGEVGLSGEVRSCSQIEARVKEAEKLGFTTCIMPKSAAMQIKNAGGMRLIGVCNVRQAIVYAAELSKKS